MLPEEVHAGAIDATRDEVVWLNEVFGVPLYSDRPDVAEARDVERWPAETLDAIALLLSDLGRAAAAPD